MNRNDFQELASIRLKDAEALLKNKNFEGSYYLSGYIIECALKACIAKNTKEYEFPPDRKIIDKIYNHDLSELIKVAGLDLNLNEKTNKDSDFSKNWSIVKDWSEKSRYEKRTEDAASSLFEAIKNPNNGVLEWLKQYW